MMMKVDDVGDNDGENDGERLWWWFLSNGDESYIVKEVMSCECDVSPVAMFEKGIVQGYQKWYPHKSNT